MTKQPHGVEGTNLSYRTIPSNVDGYSSLQEVKLTLTLQYGLDLLTDFQITEYDVERENSNLTVETPAQHCINQELKVSIVGDRSFLTSILPDML